MKVTITTDSGELVSQWKDADDMDRGMMRIQATMRHPLDEQWADDLAHDMQAARLREGRDADTGEQR